MKNYMDNKITWQAHTVMKVNEDCLKSGCYPNGRKLKPNEIEETKLEIKNCLDILINYGCVNNQLEMTLEC